MRKDKVDLSVYITDSNHRFGPGLAPNEQPMDVGKVKVGNRCWIGAKAVILKDVELGDGCVVGAGCKWLTEGMQMASQVTSDVLESFLTCKTILVPCD